MRDKQQTFSLFFPAPMDEQDFTNLTTSGVRRCQLFLGLARDPRFEAQLTRLHQLGVRVSLRVEEPDPGHSAGSYYNLSNHAQIVQNIITVGNKVPVEAVIIGNEPQGFFDMTRGSASWGNKPDGEFPMGRAEHHQYAFGQLRMALQSLGKKVVSPGYKRGRVRPMQPPQPGNTSWSRTCTEQYNQADAGGIHIYADALLSEEDQNRYLWAVGEEMERVHTRIWLNETNVNSPSTPPVGKMRAVMAFYELLALRTWAVDLIESFTPFVSNGLAGQTWSHQILRDPVCYQELGQWLRT